MTFPFPVFSPKATAAPSKPNITYEDTKSNTVNGTSGAVTLSIAAGNVSDDIYVMIVTARASGNMTADPTATFSAGTPSLVTSFRSGIYGCALYKLTAVGVTSLTATISGVGNTINTFVAHCWSSPLTTKTYQNRVTYITSGSTAVFTNIPTGNPGFVLWIAPHGGSFSYNSNSYTGADTVAVNHQALIENGVLFMAGSIPLVVDSGNKNLTINFAGTAANCALAAAFY